MKENPYLEDKYKEELDKLYGKKDDPLKQVTDVLGPKGELMYSSNFSVQGRLELTHCTIKVCITRTFTDVKVIGAAPLNYFMEYQGPNDLAKILVQGWKDWDMGGGSVAEVQCCAVRTQHAKSMP